MSGFDWSALEERGPDCPPEPALERLHLQAGAPDALATLRAHVDGCEMCTAHMQRLGMGFDVAPEVDPRALLAGVRRRLDDGAEAGPVEAARRWWRWLWIAVPVAAALIVWVATRPAVVDPEPPGPRFKGAVALEVHRQLDDGSEPVNSGDRFAPGDRLRLVATLPEPGNVAVWGLEDSGAVYRAWPFDEPFAALPAGIDQPLDGAIELDDAPGREVLTLVVCPDGAEPRCVAAADGLACPEDCRLAPFVLDKGPRQ